MEQTLSLATLSLATLSLETLSRQQAHGRDLW